MSEKGVAQLKILYWTDPHILGRNPGSRIDNYPEALHKKVLEMEHVCRAERPTAMVIGGDLYDQPRIADSIKTRYNKIFRRITKKLGIPIYLVPGNHDLFGYSMDTIDQTAIGVQASAGVFTLITRAKSYKTNGIRLEDKANGVTVAIHGQEYHKDIDTDPQNDYQISADRGATWNILFSHGMLLDKPFHPDVTHTLTKDVYTDADMVVNGHYHPGMDIHTENDTIFANPGSTGRDEICKRQPHYAIIYADATDLEIEYYEFQVAHPAADVFDHTAKVQTQAHQRYLEAFEQTVEDAITFDAFDAKDFLTQLGQTNQVDPAVIADAFAAIVAAESVEKVNKLDGYVEKLQALAISKIEIENFQSHAKTVIELNETGLNALTGASDSGKSAIIRAIRWALYNDPKGTDFIRHGESRATVTVTFNDGSAITRSRTNSSSGEYIVRDANGQTTDFKGFGNDIPIDVANTHQMPRVELSPGVERSLNFSYQLDGHFLLSESPIVRASTIGRLTGVQIVDAALREKQKDIRNLTRDFNAAEKRVADLDTKLGSFTDLTGIKDAISLASALLLNAESVEKQINELEALNDAIADLNQKELSLEAELVKYDGLHQAEALIAKAEAMMAEINELSNLRTAWKDSVADVKRLDTVLGRYTQMDTAGAKLDTATTLLAEIEELARLNWEYNDNTIAVSDLEKKLERYNNLSQVQDCLDRIDFRTAEIAELTTLHNQLVFQDKEVSRIEIEQMENNNQLLKLEAEMQELLEEMGNKCPTCNQEVDLEHLVAHQ